MQSSNPLENISEILKVNWLKQSSGQHHQLKWTTAWSTILRECPMCPIEVAVYNKWQCWLSNLHSLSKEIDTATRMQGKVSKRMVGNLQILAFCNTGLQSPWRMQWCQLQSKQHCTCVHIFQAHSVNRLLNVLIITVLIDLLWKNSDDIFLSQFSGDPL